MKTDKILFFSACICMGFILNSALNKNNVGQCPKQNQNTNLLGDSVRLKNLSTDTVNLSNAVKSDTLKLLKKAK